MKQSKNSKTKAEPQCLSEIGLYLMVKHIHADQATGPAVIIHTTMGESCGGFRHDLGLTPASARWMATQLNQAADAAEKPLPSSESSKSDEPGAPETCATPTTK